MGRSALGRPFCLNEGAKMQEPGAKTCRQVLAGCPYNGFCSTGVIGYPTAAADKTRPLCLFMYNHLLFR